MEEKSLKSNKSHPASKPKSGKNWLLAIGINDYVHCAKLGNAVRDAEAVTALLHERFQFHSDHTLSLFDKAATRRAIRQSFKDLQKRISPGDNLIIFFSGHGHFDDGFTKEAFWVPVDADYDDDGTYVAYSFIQNAIKALPTQHTLLIIDSCYSGAILVRAKSTETQKATYESDPSRYIIASGRNEVVPDGQEDGHSPFAEELLSLLKKHAHEGINTARLADRLTNNVSWNYKQTPIGEPLFGVGHKGGQFVFHPQRSEERDWKEAQKADTPASYQQYLKAWPEGKYADEALWLWAKKEDRKFAYRRYVDSRPNGRFFDSAIQKIGEIEDKDRFENAKRRGEASLIQFRRSYPESAYHQKALEEITKIREGEKERSPIDATPLAQPFIPQKQEPNERQKPTRKKPSHEEKPFWKKRSIQIAAILGLLMGSILGISQLKGGKGEESPPAPSSQTLIAQADSLYLLGKQNRNLKDIEDARYLYKESQKEKETPKAKAHIAAIDMWIMAYNDSLEANKVKTKLETDPLTTLQQKGYTIGPFIDGVAIYSLGNGKNIKMGLVNSKGSLLGKPYYKVEDLAHGFAVFHKGGKRGYLNLKGKEIIAAQYQSAYPFDSKGRAKVKEKGRFIYIDKNGKCVENCLVEVIEPEPMPAATDQLPIPKMKRISGGTFDMGSNAGGSDEKPIHEVKVSTFEMGVYEVTQKEWKAVMGNNPSNFKCENCPVEEVSWDYVQTYIRKLNQLTKSNYRLPTEAEWEYAAGGGANNRTVYAGTSSKSSLGAYGWYISNSNSKTHPKGEKQPNDLGLYDMSGNVWEWCQDWYGDYPKSTQTNPPGPKSGSVRVIRGGNWNHNPRYCRVTHRASNSPSSRNGGLGFRLSRTP